MESSLSRKRKANEIYDEYDMDKVWGIVTNAQKWYFMECTLENERKPVFKLSKPLFVAYEDEATVQKDEALHGRRSDCLHYLANTKANTIDNMKI
ncbi:hypothetical protein GLOIN_2v1788173 [Rhizophagus irregularis DAOM 181602=DAOM 197198]|nr:hypothetical protein GLOIN_2v1788173 [Rhizophagus irregularis DAOM 181602=DAOM 197198]